MSRPGTSSWSRRRGAPRLRDGRRRTARDGPRQRRDADAMRAILLGGGLALLISLLGTRVAIRAVHQLGLRPGDPRRRPDHPPHQARHARPWAASSSSRRPCSATSLAKLITQHRAVGAPRCCCSSCSSGMGVVGFLDDFIKISKQRSLGLRSKAKMVGQTVIALVFGVPGALADARGRRGTHPGLARTSRSSATSTASRCPRSWSILLFWVIDHRHQQRGEPHRRPRRPRDRRLRDGLRRLHAGQHLAEQPVLRGPARARPATRSATRSTSRVVAAAITGACFGFLWWNASPAADLHGRHRLAVARRRAGRLRDPDPHRAAAGHPRRPVRRRSRCR